MCGIAGILDLGGGLPIRADELERMAGALAHRGPDDSGIYIDSDSQQCGLAHRRLAVIDIEGGHQPLANEDESLWICYNGECYNFPELKRQMEASGTRFRTNCDTEVVLKLYQRYGSRCVEHLRGMFSFAVWDRQRRELFLARDRLGQKPLYYAVHKGRFIFASECKAVLQTDNFPRLPDRRAITQYLLLQYVPYPSSGFADIKQLPPAHTLTLSADNYSNAEPQRYWAIPTRPCFTGSLDEAAEELHSELAEATRMRMISDVPLGAFLSGGLDSSIIVGLMSRVEEQPVKTCSIGFKESRYYELPYARQLARQFDCDHHEQMVSPDCAETVEKLSYYYDEPFADCSALPTFHLSRLARSRVTVALTGDGADECFGGYVRYKALMVSEKINHNRLLGRLARQRFWERITGGEQRSFLRNLKRLMTATQLPIHQRYLKWLSVFDPDMLSELLTDSDAVENHWNYLADYFPDFSGSSEHADARNKIMAQAMLADGNTYLTGDLNTKIDRASMSTGLELRCPFQDHKVVELAYSLPTGFRHNGKIGKVILRRAFGDIIPRKIARRSKRGFGVPVGRWFRRELRQMFIDTVLSQRALQRGYFRREAIEKLLRENDLKKDDHGHRLWALLMLELWHRRYIDS
ncbi:MAG: asparagine synthase (glutamine-hydrolyzing) [Sedimentisphaerales bacterium]|nr:asparagine synthase (glutamine-hydrolyzing) [Sedimentisphaerales bacterium]